VDRRHALRASPRTTVGRCRKHRRKGQDRGQPTTYSGVPEHLGGQG
jgi:hypothetical protein